MEEQELRQESDNQLSLQTLFLEVRKNVLLIAVITLLFALAGAAYARYFVKTRYTSSGALMVNVTYGEGSEIKGETTAYSYSIAITDTVSKFITTSKVAEKAAELYKEKYGEDIPSYALGVTTTEKNFIINVSCTSTNRETKQILDVVMDATKAAANELKGQDGNHTVFYNKLFVFEDASEGWADSGARMYKYVLIFMLLGLVVSAVVIILKILFNDTYRFKEDVEKDLSVEILALIDDLTGMKEGK